MTYYVFIAVIIFLEFRSKSVHCRSCFGHMGIFLHHILTKG